MYNENITNERGYTMIQSVRIAIDKTATHKFIVQEKKDDKWSNVRRFKRKKVADTFIAELYRNTSKEKDFEVNSGEE